MPTTAARAVPRTRSSASPQSKDPNRRKKCSLAEERAKIVARYKNSKRYAELRVGVLLQMGPKTSGRWEGPFLGLIRALAYGKKATDPMTKRDIAAHLGCSERTANTVVSRLLKDKLIDRKRKPGRHGWCYFSTDAMVISAPDIEEEEVEEDLENDESEEGEEKAKEGVEEDSLESDTYKENIRKPLRMFDAPRLLFPGHESASVPVPEGVPIKSVRVAETAESDVSLSWSDAVIDEQGEITIWVHGCRKKSSPAPQVESTPVAEPPREETRVSADDELRKVFEGRFGKRIGAREFRLQLPKIDHALAGAPFPGYVRYVVDVKLPEKDAPLKPYQVKPPLFVDFAIEFRDKYADLREDERERKIRQQEHDTKERERMLAQARDLLSWPNLDRADREMLLESWPELRDYHKPVPELSDLLGET